MEDNDYLKEILEKVDQIYQPIDFEKDILNTLQKEQKLKTKIAAYKSQGKKALLVSGILIIVLGILFSTPGNHKAMEQTVITYSSISLVLILLFFQLEVSSSRVINQLKNNQS